jgi:serine/threonine-protein kinase
MEMVPEYDAANAPVRAVLFILLCLAFLIPLAVVTWKWWRSRLVASKLQNASRSSCPAPARLEQLLTGGLPPSEQAKITAHLEACEDCQRDADKLVAGKDSWTDVAKHLRHDRPRPEEPLGRVMEKLKAEASAVQTHDHTPTEDLSLDFLTPSTQPGHLGRLDHYEVLEVIGRGGMGVVLKALDPTLHRIVAIKVLAPQLATSGTARRRFTREAQAAAAVSHDHVVTIHAVEEANGLPYLVMQYIAGISLQERLDKGGPLELKEILRIGMQTASGLAAAHAQGLVHRDIKPANILLENGVQRVKITDFGLARAADDASLTQSGVVAGTPQYMAPEQARGEAVDHRADLFSLGSVLHAMCTGRPPFCASTAMAVLRRVSDDTPRSIKELNPEIPDWLVAIVEKLHAKDPSERFQSAREVTELLNQHLAQLQQASWTPPPGGLIEKTPASAASATAPITSLTICPSCGCHLHIPDKLVGRVVSCPQCSKPFQVEDTSQEIQVIAAGKPQLLQATKPKRKVPLGAWLTGAVAALLILCGGGIRLYYIGNSGPSTMPATPTLVPPVPVSSPYKGKLDAALAIRDIDQRDAILAKIAVEAAATADVTVVMNALGEIRFIVLRDKTAATCALRLAKNGRNAKATQIAKGIRDLLLRDDVLGKLAKGELGP